jgi:starch synthase
MYSQLYGTLPVVRAVGGLRDTVVNLDEDLANIDSATGFVFREPTVTALTGAIERALEFYDDKPVWRRIQDNGMARDFSWLRSARAYQALYQGLL